MSSDTKYKYAVVRLPENSVVDFFSLIVGSKLFFQRQILFFRFQKAIQMCLSLQTLVSATWGKIRMKNSRPPPHPWKKWVSRWDLLFSWYHLNLQTQSNDDDSTSENNKSSPPRRQSTGSTSVRPAPLPTVKTENFDSWTPTAPSSNPTPDLLSAAMPAELLTNLFSKVSRSFVSGSRSIRGGKHLLVPKLCQYSSTNQTFWFCVLLWTNTCVFTDEWSRD